MSSLLTLISPKNTYKTHMIAVVGSLCRRLVALQWIWHADHMTRKRAMQRDGFAQHF